MLKDLIKHTNHTRNGRQYIFISVSNRSLYKQIVIQIFFYLELTVSIWAIHS